jgi:hypothetical protein
VFCKSSSLLDFHPLSLTAGTLVEAVLQFSPLFGVIHFVCITTALKMIGWESNGWVSKE